MSVVKVERARIAFSTTPEIKALIVALYETGLYGRTYHETAERLVTESLQRRLLKAILDEDIQP